MLISNYKDAIQLAITLFNNADKNKMQGFGKKGLAATIRYGNSYDEEDAVDLIIEYSKEGFLKITSTNGNDKTRIEAILAINKLLEELNFGIPTFSYLINNNDENDYVLVWAFNAKLSFLKDELNQNVNSLTIYDRELELRLRG